MTWLPESGPGGTDFDRTLGLRPELRADLESFERLLWESWSVDPALLELCRLRIAQLLGWAPEVRRRGPAKIAEAKRAALETWRRSGAFSPLERACLELTEGFVLDPHGVSEANVGAVAAYLDPAGVVLLVEALALFDGFTRFRAILGVED
jgi:alkylhydroperoxidase family enzyme